jgi:NRPS condensation-like uncharacterized protein
MVLPLPLVPFEQYMLADDRPAYPMNFFVRLRFAGRFDRRALDAAMSAALARHPLLTAIARRSRRGWIWEAADRLPAVQWLTCAPGESLPALEPLDVRVEPGFRVTACEGQGRTDLVMQVHHACCDGLATFAFAEDLLANYAAACGTAPGMTPRPLERQLLRRRGRFGLTTGQFLSVLPKQLVGLLGARQFLMRRPEPLVPTEAQRTGENLKSQIGNSNMPQGQPPSGYPASWTRQLDESQTAGLLTAARTLGVTLNDLLLHGLFLCLAKWRQRHALDRPGAWLRVCVPVSLRTAALDRLPAANAASMVFLDRRPHDTSDPDRLLASIHKEMQLIKRMQLGLTFVLCLGLRRWLPGFAPAEGGDALAKSGGVSCKPRADRCFSTAILTNLGTLLGRCPLADERGRVRAGGAILEDMDLLPPLRPLTSAAFTAWSYAHRLNFTLHYDPRVLEAGHAAELLDDMIGSVQRSAGTRVQTVAEVGA